MGSASKESEAARKKAGGGWRRLARRAGFGLLGVVVIGVVAFFLLPVWISNEQGRTYILERMNQKIGGKVEVGSWSLGWFRGTEFRNVSLSLPSGQQLLTCRRVESELTLWGILWGNYDVGLTRVEGAEVTLAQYKDRRTSMDVFFGDKGGGAGGAEQGRPPPQAMGRIFRTLRGSLQMDSGLVRIESEATGKTAVYRDVKAAVTIASPEAPFHVQVSGVGDSGNGMDASISLSATLPAISSWPAPAWRMVSDMELSATNVPTGLACAWAGLDPSWEDSFGAVLEQVQFSNHVAPPLETSSPALTIRGTRGAWVDARLMLQAAGGEGGAGPATLSLAPSPSPPPLPSAEGGAGGGFHAGANLRVSAPLVRLLGRINPMLGAIRSGAGPIDIDLDELQITSGNLSNVRAAGRLTFPALEMDRGGIVGEILKIGGATDAAGRGWIAMTADPLRLRMGGGSIGYENFELVLGRRQRVRFSGTVGLDGRLNLTATVPGASGALGASTVVVPVTGTVERPVVTLP